MPGEADSEKEKARIHEMRAFIDLATTYSRASYTGTTIGPAAFHGRVRNGNGWSHRGIITRKIEFEISNLRFEISRPHPGVGTTSSAIGFEVVLEV